MKDLVYYQALESELLKVKYQDQIFCFNIKNEDLLFSL